MKKQIRKPYLFEKFEQLKKLLKIFQQTKTQTGFIHCPETDMKPYRSTKNLTIRYVLESSINNELPTNIQYVQLAETI